MTRTTRLLGAGLGTAALALAALLPAVSASAAPASADRLAGPLILVDGSHYGAVEDVAGLVPVAYKGISQDLDSARAGSSTVEVPGVGTTGPITSGAHCLTAGFNDFTYGTCDSRNATQQFTTVRNADGSLSFQFTVGQAPLAFAYGSGPTFTVSNIGQQGRVATFVDDFAPVAAA